MSGLPRCKATGKVRFRDEHAARKFLDRSRDRKAEKRRERRVYWCPRCRGYHTTSWRESEYDRHRERGLR